MRPVGHCRVSSLQKWGWVQGTYLGGSGPDRAGRALEAHAQMRIGAQGHTVGVSLGESGLAFC